MPSDIFENDCVRVSWDPTAAIVRLDWKRAADEQSYRQGMEAALVLVERMRACSVLADCTRLEQLAALGERWAERALAAGLKRTALVMRQSPRGKGPCVPAGQTHYFTNVKAARSWLLMARA